MTHVDPGEERPTARDPAMVRALVEIADTLVERFEVLDFLYMVCERCAQVLDVDEVGVLLTDPDGILEISAASSEKMDLLELFEMQQQEGPCYDAFVTGTSVAVDDLRAAEVKERWPRFAPRALEAGFRSAYGFPLRLRENVIGALNIFRHHRRGFDQTDVFAARAMADMAAIGIMQERVVREADVRAEQLQRALDSRVLIEQAKGVLAERLGISPGEAFVRLRDHARRNRRPIKEVCAAVLEGDLSFG